MSRFFTLITLFWCCAYLFPLQAQNVPSCNANFQFTVNANVVSFFSITSVPGTAIKHVWKFGDDTQAENIANPVHTYKHNGTYTVKHITKDSLGTCIDTVMKQVVITNTPCKIESYFKYRNDSLGNCKKVYFQNLSVINTSPSSQTTYQWNFGDGTRSGDFAPAHTYPDTGTYTVCLIMEAGANCRKEYCMQVKVQCAPNPPPPTCTLQASFDFKTDSLQKNKVYFKSTVTNAGISLVYIWKFGDGSSSNDANPTHVYQQPGIYKVCLVVESGNNCRREICKEVNISFTNNNCDFRPAFTFKRDSVQPNKVYFYNKTINPHPSIKYIWKFGDGTTSSDLNPAHVYTQAGVYNVCLVAETNSCRKDTCMMVQVAVPSVCAGRSNFTYRVYPNNVLEYGFKPDSVNSTWKYYWNFGDGTTSNSFAPAHKFPFSGNFKVCLTVVANNCQTTTCKEIKVGAVCDSFKVRFEFKRNPNVPNQISFMAIGNQTIVKQRWTIYRQTTLAPVVMEGNNPTYTFRDTGYYKVCLLATAANGCKKEYCETIRIEKVVNTNGGYLTVFPNPASSVVNFEVKLEKPGKVYIRVLNSFGIPVITREVTGVTGNNAFTIPVQQLSAGYYTLEVKYDGHIKIGRFQKI